MSTRKTIGQGAVVRQFVTAARASRKLSANAKHVLHELLEHDGQGGAAQGSAWMTQPELALACGLSTVTAGRMVDELREAGVVSVTRVYPRQKLPSGETSEHGCTVFVFAFDAIAQLGPQLPTHVLGPASSRGLEDLRAEVRKEFEERFAALEAKLAGGAGGGSGGELAIVCEGVDGESAALGGLRVSRIRCNAITDGISDDPIGECGKGLDYAEAA